MGEGRFPPGRNLAVVLEQRPPSVDTSSGLPSPTLVGQQLLVMLQELNPQPSHRVFLTLLDTEGHSRFESPCSVDVLMRWL